MSGGDIFMAIFLHRRLHRCGAARAIVQAVKGHHITYGTKVHNRFNSLNYEWNKTGSITWYGRALERALQQGVSNWRTDSIYEWAWMRQRNETKRQIECLRVCVWRTGVDSLARLATLRHHDTVIRWFDPRSGQFQHCYTIRKWSGKLNSL